jgi:hypothetical protein
MSLSQSSEVYCPYCYQFIEITIDPSVDSQEYIEDCTVCCRPISLRVLIDEDGHSTVVAGNEND